VATHRTDHNNSTIEYNNHSISLSNTDAYEILDHTSFHYYPPVGERGGTHRSLSPQNVINDNFNINDAARQSCLHFSRKNNFLSNLKLSWQQKRLAVWTAFGMNQTRDLVLSFGFNTETTELAHIIAKRMARFVKAARHTNSKKGRAPDDQ